MFYLFGNPHQQNARHLLNEDVPHPARHPMRAGLPVVEVQYNGGEADADRHQHHGEQEVTAQQWQCQGCCRDYFNDEGEVQGLGDEDGNSQGGLLPRLGRQVEDQDRQVEYPHTGDYQVHYVEQRLAAYLQIEKYI